MNKQKKIEIKSKALDKQIELTKLMIEQSKQRLRFTHFFIVVIIIMITISLIMMALQGGT